MIQLNLLFLAFFLLHAPHSIAGEYNNIHFPLEKNGARLLSQKIEYQVIDDNTIKVGNLKISATDLKIEISERSADVPDFAFWGPSQLLQNATLLIRDPTSRSIWSSKIDNSQLEIAKNSESKSEVPLSIYRVKSISSSELKKISKNIFFNYCIFFEDEIHRYNLCSKDYRLNKSGKNWELNPIISGKKRDFIVQVNGVEVGSEGILQLSEKVSAVSFSSRLASGLLFEFRTGNIPIEVIDAKYETGSSFATLLVREQDTKNKFKLKEPWETKVVFTESYFYLSGESLIPMKQEVIFNDKPPSEKVRPKLVNNVYKTYSNSLSVELEKSAETKIQAKTEGDSVNNSNTTSIWNLNNIRMDDTNIHYIEVENNNKKYLGSFEVLRGIPWEAKLNLKQSQQATTTSDKPGQGITLMGSGYDFNMTYHASSFFGSNSEFGQLKWFTEIISQGLNYSRATGSGLKMQENALNFGYRFSYGFHHETPSAGITFGYLSRSLDADSAASPTYGFFYKNPKVDLDLIGDTLLLDFKMAPALKYTLSQLAGSMMTFKFENQYKLSNSNFWLWKFNIENNTMTAKEINLSTKTQIMELAFGLGAWF